VLTPAWRWEGSALYMVPAGGGVTALFAAMQGAQREGLLEDWGIGQATLEDVFVRVTEEAEAEKAAAPASPIKPEGARDTAMPV
jgi:hypothetical protein